MARQIAPLGYDTSRTKPILVKSMRVITNDLADKSYDLPYQGWDINNYSGIAPVNIRYGVYDGPLELSPLIKNGDSLMKYVYEYQKQYLGYLTRMVTEKDESKRLEYEKKEAEINDKAIIMASDLIMKRLVPVVIRMSEDPILEKSPFEWDTMSHMTGRHIYLWYVPTEEFISALPDRYSNKLRKELDLLHKFENREITYEDACRNLTEAENFFDLCRMKSGALEYISGYPNPAKDKIQIKYLITQPRKISLSLHDMRGSLIKMITQDDSQPAGEHDITINLGGLESGMYIIALQSQEQEQVVFRFIVR
jgi:hypothetical protein